MTSRLRAAVATLFVAFSFAYALGGVTATPAAPTPDCIRPCHF